MTYIKIIVILIILYNFYFAICSDADKKCRNGTCKKMYDCKIDDLNKLKLCGFEGVTPVVCCPNNLQQLPSLEIYNPNVNWLNGHQNSKYLSHQPPLVVNDSNWSSNEFLTKYSNQQVALETNSNWPDRFHTKSFNHDFEKKLSVSERKCKEFVKILSKRVDTLFFSAGGHIVSQDVPDCDYNNVLFVVGGVAAKANEFPHMAVLGYGNGPNYDFRCGGTLISENFVLTAAHCTKTYVYGNPSIVRLGEIDLISHDDGAEPIDIKVINVYLHPEFNPPKKYNDIALIELESYVNFNKKIYPACLATKLQQYSVKNVIATGWGKTAYYEDSGSNILLKVSLPIINPNECDKLWTNIIRTSTSKLPHGLNHDTMICAGDLDGGRDACSGDSGGPITVPYNKNQCIHHVLGIVSFGSYCGFASSPAIYTKLYKYIPWIESIVWPGQ